jgi:hypothetical protein
MVCAVPPDLAVRQHVVIEKWLREEAVGVAELDGRVVG